MSDDKKTETKIWFSDEHIGKNSVKLENDTYRSSPDNQREKTEKIAHETTAPGYG